MNRTDRFDDIVSDWLHADAEHRVPEHLDAVLRRTRTERQRPAWSSLERWLPVDTTLRLAPVPRGAAAVWSCSALAIAWAIGVADLDRRARSRVAPTLRTRSQRRASSTGATGRRHLRDRSRHERHRPSIVAERRTIDFATVRSRPTVRGSMIVDRADQRRRVHSCSMLADADGTSPRPSPKRADRPRQFGHRWSPDGSRVAVVSGRRR